MLITNEVPVKWNSKNKKHFELLGYKFTKMKDEFIVNVNHLKIKSMVYVCVICDYCGKEYNILWLHRTTIIEREKNLHKDCCLSCTPKKASETMLIRYNKSNALFIDEFKEKQKETILKKYGVENVFQNEEIKNKIKDVNLLKYSVDSYTKTEECQEKKKNTCLRKYGVTNYTKTKEYKLLYSKENSPCWKGGHKRKRTERMTIEYRDWRSAVFEKDNYKCLKCEENTSDLQAHHILSWKDHDGDRYNVKNGATLCRICHIEFHKIYGKTKADKEDLIEFIQT